MSSASDAAWGVDASAASGRDGILIVDKAPGMTSHDVVEAVRRRFGTRKVGHAGTLDPDATGLLILGLGRATRFLTYTQDAPKRYRAVGKLGTATSTQDASGEVTERRPVTCGQDEVRAALGRFRGPIDQIPPMVSAVKIGGERLYKKARRGEEVERPVRRVTVYELSVTAWSPGEEPELTLDILCSGGTYVRTLVHDLGTALGCMAHLVSLRRTEAGGFTEADAAALEDLGPGDLRPLATVAHLLPAIEVDEAGARAVSHGSPLEVTAPGDAGAAVAVTHGGRLLAVYRVKKGRLKAERVVPEEVT